MTTKRTINGVALLVLLGGAALAGGGVYLLHGIQVKRNAGALLVQADDAERAGQTALVGDYLAQYLGLEPNDAAALARYSSLEAKQAKSRQEFRKAFFDLEKAVRMNESKPEVRRELIRFAIRIRWFPDARVHLKILRDAGDDAELLALQARCERGELQFVKAAGFYEQALDENHYNHAEVDVCLEYAYLMRNRQQDPAAADDEIEKMLQALPRSLPARLGAARYYRQYALWDKAEAAVTAALNLGAREVDDFLLATEVAEFRHKPDLAREYLQQGLKLHPTDSRLKQRSARRAFMDGNMTGAKEQLESILKNMPKDPDELWTLGNLCIDSDQLEPVGGIIKRLVDINEKWAADYLKARLRIRKEAWGEARGLLEDARTLGPPSKSMAAQVDLLLAGCHERLGNPDQELKAARRALEASPNLPQAHRSAAVALTSLGKLDEAIREYELVSERTPAVEIEYGRLLLVRNLFLAAGKQSKPHWEELDPLLKRLPADLPAQVFRAEVLAAQNKTADAVALMEKERDRDPKQLQPWLFLAALAEKQDEGKTALPLLDKAQQATGPRVEWTLARAQHWLRSGTEKARAELPKLKEDLKQFEGGDRDRLLGGLGQAFLSVGDAKEAAALWKEQAGNQPGNLTVRVRLVDLAYHEAFGAISGDELEQLVGEIRQLEGGEDGGALTAAGEACKLVLQARLAGDKTLLPMAREQARKADELRPTWSAPPLLEAEAFDLEGRTDKALEKYQTAIGRGENRLAVVRRVLVLLASHRRIADAQALLARLPERSRSLAGIDRIGVQLELLGPDQKGSDPKVTREHALEAARKAVPAGSKDFRDYLWLGQIAVLADKKKEAEDHFRKARDLKDDVPDTWVTLILLLIQTNPNDPKPAEAELEAAKKKLPSNVLPLVQAVSYEALGKPKEAEEAWKSALEANRDDALVLRNVANFYVRSGQTAKAEPLLRTLLVPKTGTPETLNTWARHTLAMTQAFRGTYRQFKEAQELMKERPNETTEDKRTRAFLLATRLESRRDAIRLFESLSAGDVPATAEVKYMLANLYEADSNWTKAKSQLVSLVNDDNKNPVSLAYYIRALLRNKQAEEALPLLDQLDKLEAAPLDKIELRARVLHATAKTDEAVKLVQAYSREDNARLDVAAALLDQLGKTAEAEQLYREFVRTSKEPLRELVLARHLGQHDKLPEAFALCDQAWAKWLNEPATEPATLGHLSATATLGVTLLHNPKATADQFQSVEQHLKTMIGRDAKTQLYPALLAEIYTVRERYSDVAGLYRKILERDARNIVALNNLAVLLALNGDEAKEALKLIQTAIDEAGPLPELLDTQAIVYLRSNQPDLAIGDLKQAIIEAPGPTKYFHLAQAYLLKKDRTNAAEAYKKTGGLKLADLHPLEKPAERALKVEFVDVVPDKP